MLPLPVHEPCAPSQLADFSLNRFPRASTMYRPWVDSGGCQVSVAAAVARGRALVATGSGTVAIAVGAVVNSARTAAADVRCLTSLRVVGIRSSVGALG